MAVVVWLRIVGAELVEAAESAVADIDAGYTADNVTARVGARVDWSAAGERAGAIAGRGMGGMLKIGGPFVLMAVADWFLDGALELLATDAGKPAADALADLGAALVAVMAKVVKPLITVAFRVIRALVPMASAALLLTTKVLAPMRPALELAADVLHDLDQLGRRIARGIVGIGRQLRAAWALIHNALRRIARAIDDAVAGVAGAIGRLLGYVIEWVIGPLRDHLANLASSWNEWVGRHLPDFGELRKPTGYMWNDVWYEWGTGPLGEAPHSRVIEHPASDAQLVAAIATYARANGGIARAVWTPA